jgi:uncharacterized small protein (DUF1192 family)
MDWDDLKPKAQKGIVIGEPLAALSIDELEARTAALQAEIGRVADEIKRKEGVQAAAKSAFKT